MPESAGAGLRERVLALFGAPIDEPLSDEVFDDIALATFAFQFEHNAPYAAYCTRRGRTPSRVTHWEDIPAVPTAAFKHVVLAAGDQDRAQAVFRTSGTTTGEASRGTHYVLDLALYHGSLLPTFSAHVLPDGARLPIYSLIPPASELRDSSLAHMVARLMSELGDAGSGYFASVERGIHEHELEATLAAADEPVCLVGTSFSYVHWLDSLRERGRGFRLREGSRLMDTGGYKGRGREVPATDMLRAYREQLGVPATHCVNEYGMTELCSQQYDRHLRDAIHGAAPRWQLKQGPPWLRTRVVDPETLQPVADGTPGLLQHVDLANLYSVLAVQTEDVGVREAGGIRLLGRITAAPPRGCSIAMDDLLRAVRDTHP